MATTSLQQNWDWSKGILCQDWQGTHRSAFLHMVIFYILKSQLLLLRKCWHSRNLLTNPRLEFIARPLLPPGCGIRKSQESWHPWMPSRARLSLAICLVFHSHAPQGSVQSGCPSTARTFLHTCKESAIMYQIKRCIHLQHNNVLQEQGFFSVLNGFNTEREKVGGCREDLIRVLRLSIVFRDVVEMLQQAHELC